MPPLRAPYLTTHAPNGMVCSVDHLASAAGVGVLRDGGNAVDAAIATSAVLAVTTQHMCGIGGDLFALVHHGDGPPTCLNAAGRAGSGASAAALRAEGHDLMPFQRHLAPVTVPGCVDGWLALHERHGRVDLDRVFRDAIRFAEQGFPASPYLVGSVPLIVDVDGADDYASIRSIGDLVRRPKVAAHLRAIVDGGRSAFYEGSFGEALIAAGDGLYSSDDLSTPGAEWVDALGLRAFDHECWTVPPPSQGYLSLAGTGIVERIGVPADPSSGAWAHALAEAARLAGYDRTDVLHDRADGAALIAAARLDDRAARFDPDRRADLADAYGGGGTIHLTTADSDGMAVSLIQSNAKGWGTEIVVDGVFLHNRGNGFSLVDGHPAEYAPGRQPPHTLSPALVTRPDGSLRAVLGTMGGDSQPQIVQQMLVRLLVHGESPSRCVGSPRFVLGGGATGFDVWNPPGPSSVVVEHGAPAAWARGLAVRGHDVDMKGPDDGGFGHAHLIEVNPAGGWRGASDPRALTGAAQGH